MAKARDRKPPLTLRERAQQWVYDAQQREIIDPVTHADAFIAGWHGRGRAERLEREYMRLALAHRMDGVTPKQFNRMNELSEILWYRAKPKGREVNHG